MSVNNHLYRCLSRLVFASKKHLPKTSARENFFINNLDSKPTTSNLVKQTPNIVARDFKRFVPAITGRNLINADKKFRAFDNGMENKSNHILHMNSALHENRTIQSYTLSYAYNSQLVIPCRYFSSNRILNTKVRIA